ncbi:hypothetical protein LOTGIDRAFT_165585 [Lottia gigantea]|uniref:Uncharacterized protein n=1 Tax=Lottia gigantea TaxID=225164 RepID=V3ZVS8_LOTGI|nr:hypothetical protein LOTGIDRAFT_165585 [Lottia gigantea]ESO88457.1 hypothetical protein LOTGIDRAFT_165585 [Lottia gigantea]
MENKIESLLNDETKDGGIYLSGLTTDIEYIRKNCSVITEVNTLHGSFYAYVPIIRGIRQERQIEDIVCISCYLTERQREGYCLYIMLFYRETDRGHCLYIMLFYRETDIRHCLYIMLFNRETDRRTRD